VIVAATAFGASPPGDGVLLPGSNENVIVVDPDAAADEAWNENATGAYSGAARTARSGVTVTPGGSSDFATVTTMSEVGAHAPATTDATIGAGGPPAFKVTAEGVTAGVKAGGRTFAMNVASAAMPRESLTRAVTVIGPAGAPGAALTVKETTREGGTSGTRIVEGVTVSVAGRPGNETVGVPT
jgi:hypothetical protein